MLQLRKDGTGDEIRYRRSRILHRDNSRVSSHLLWASMPSCFATKDAHMFTHLLIALASPHGRLPRASWLLRLVMLSVCALAFGMLALAAAGNDGAALVALLYLWCAGCLAVRRLHDTSRSGYALLAVLVPGIGALWLLLALLRAGAEGRNRYGDDPLSRLDYLRVDIAK
jgi:uncharacterized membrane protein YhaH (DUF805 family)